MDALQPISVFILVCGVMFLSIAMIATGRNICDLINTILGKIFRLRGK